MDGRVFSLAWPCIVSEISTPLLSVVDTLVVGHLPDADALAGVALGVAILNPLLLVFNFLRMATGGATAQAFGARESTEVLATVIRAVLIGAAIGFALLALCGPVMEVGLFFVPPPSDAVRLRALQYVRCRIVGAPAALANFAVAAWFNGVQHPRVMLAHSAVLNASNALLCVVLGWHLRLGVSGVGAATAIANYVALGFGFCQIWRIYHRLPGCHAADSGDAARRQLQPKEWLAALVNPRKIRGLFAVQGNVFLRSLCLLALITRFNALSAQLGGITLSANSLLTQLQMLLSYGADGFANAAEALVGEAYGKGDLAMTQQVLASIARWSVVVIAAFTCTYMLLGVSILQAFSSHHAVVAYASSYVVWQYIAPVFSVPAYVLDGVFVGANRYGDMRAANFWALVAFLLLSEAGRGSNDLLWASYLAHLVVRASVLLWRSPLLMRAASVHGKAGRGAPLLS